MVSFDVCFAAQGKAVGELLIAQLFSGIRCTAVFRQGVWTVLRE